MKKNKIVAAALSLAFVTASITGVASAEESHVSNGYGGGKIKICKRTGSVFNPYVEVSVSLASVETHISNGAIVPVPVGGCPTKVQKPSNKTWYQWNNIIKVLGFSR